MKKLRRKNQLLLTLLAAMIAVAGYLTYLPSQEKTVAVVGEQENSALMDISDEDVLAENIALEQAQYTGTGTENTAAEAGDDSAVDANGTVGTDDTVSAAAEQEQNADGTLIGQSTEETQPGEAVLTWSEQVENQMAEARLSREQVRTRNEETLNSIINNENLSQEQRQTAADNLMELTENAQIEADIESALQTKGIAQVLVTINETGVEVLVGSTSLTDAERAQIEDTVKRNANVEASEIVISLMNGVNTEVVEEP